MPLLADSGANERELIRLEAMQLAVSEANSAGGLNHRLYGLFACSVPPEDETAVERMTEWLPGAVRRGQGRGGRWEARRRHRGLGTAPAQGRGVAYTNFQQSFQNRFSVDPSAYSFTAHSYDAMWLTLAATAWASRANGAVTGPPWERPWDTSPRGAS